MAARILEPLLSRGLGLAPATGQSNLKPLAHAIGLQQQSTLVAEIAYNQLCPIYMSQYTL